jgi:5-(carboxyamino)imidazole ribonucleotide synthase
MKNKAFYGKRFQLGVLGGGQLGRMLQQPAISLDIDTHFLDPAADAPCSTLSTGFVHGDFNDFQTVVDFGKDKHLITIEIENVNVDALEELEKRGVQVCPSPKHLRIIKDKGLQKQFYADHGIPSSDFRLIESGSELSEKDLPIVQKMRTGGYDGKGVQVLKSAADLMEAFDAPSVLEELVNIDKELSVIVARNASGEVVVYPTVELVFNHEANLVDYLLSPASISQEQESEAKALAMKVVESMDFVGILAVEMFLDSEGNVLVNEVAPRTHNSGHQTIEANYTSQFEQHLRAILNLPLGDPSLRCPSSMINLLGEKGHTGPVVYEGMEDVLKIPKVYPHIYGKTTTKPFRKMGHITILGESLEEVKIQAKKVQNSLKVISE